MDNTGPGGTLHRDKIARALLQHRNYPAPTTGLSPAQIIFGRVLRDHLAIKPGAFPVRQEWRLEANLREKALARRHILKHEQLSHRSRTLPPLAIGDLVMVQDQAASKQPGKWTKTGKIVESQEFDSYLIKIDEQEIPKKNCAIYQCWGPSGATITNFSTKSHRQVLHLHLSHLSSCQKHLNPDRLYVHHQPHNPLQNLLLPSLTHLPLFLPKSHQGNLLKKGGLSTTNPASSSHTNSDEEPATNAAPNQTDVVIDDKNVDLPAEEAAATSTNLVSSNPIPFQIYPVPPGTKYDYEKMTREAARAPGTCRGI